MKSGIVVGLVALGLVPLSGCLEGETRTASASPNEAPAIDLKEGLRIEAKDCIQGGGNSVYKGKQNYGPFPSANQLPEIGNPTIGAFGAIFMPGDVSHGIWHVATLCKSYTYQGKEYQNFGMGWIASLIERPDFDVWGEPRIQYVVADLSFNNDDFAQSARDATGGAEISLGTAYTIEWLVPANKYMHVVLTEANHGTFDFTAEIHKEYGQKAEEHIRLWMLPSTDGEWHSHGEAQDPAPKTYRPISIDMYDTPNGKGGTRIAGESVGTFTHFPDGHFGNPLGYYVDGFDRVIEIGPAPEGVTFERTWLH